MFGHSPMFFPSPNALLKNSEPEERAGKDSLDGWTKHRKVNQTKNECRQIWWTKKLRILQGLQNYFTIL